jgi:hypothetical protein
MPFFLAAIGAVMLAAAVNGKHRELGDLWKAQFSGSGSFINVAILFFIVGAVGAIAQLKPLAIAFMSLILLVMFFGSAGTSESVNVITRIRQQVGGTTP